MSQTSPGAANNGTLTETLFANREARIFAVLDGAASPDIVKNLYAHQPEHCCLYRGELEPDIAVVAPYLARLEPGQKFTDWLLTEGWGVHWGIFLSSNTALRALRDHFREFHTVELPDQKTVLFRYYDPRVMKAFLPVCNAMELRTFFGPVQSFIIEGETPEAGLKFAFTGKGLKQESFQVKKGA